MPLLKRDTAEPPVCSVIVPTRSRQHELRRCLVALAAQEYPSTQFEVIVVDDGSEVPSDELVAPFRDKLNVTLIKQRQSGPAAARNAGSSRARGRLLVFTDDDCVPTPGWLAALASRHVASPEDAIGGNTRCAVTANPFSAASQLLVSYLYEYYNSPSPAGDALFLTSNNLALPRDQFFAIGGFDPSFPAAAAEDRDLCERWLRSGYRLVYAPEAIVQHAHVLTPLGFWRQHFAYGRGAYLFHRLRAQRARGSGKDSLQVEPLSFYLDLLRYPAMRPGHECGGHARLTLVALLAISQLANVAGYFSEKLSRSTARVAGRKLNEAAENGL